MGPMRWREVVCSLRLSSQEKWLLRQCTSFPGQIIVAHAHRGCRKTSSADALVKRFACCHPTVWPYLPFVKIVHVADRRTLHDATDGKLGDGDRTSAGLTLTNAFISYGAEFAFGLVFIVVCASWSAFRTRSKAAASKETDTRGNATVGSKEDGALAQMQAKLIVPPLEDLVWPVIVAAFTIAARLSRRKVLIVDDVLTFSVNNGKSKANTAQGMLNDLKQLSAKTSIVLLSSNEGICQLFSDTNPSTFIEQSFPDAEPAEFAAVLRRTQRKADITLDAFEELARQFGMHHHVYSMRWWKLVPPTFAACQVPRATLHKIALTLDLMCQPVARSHALAYSPQVDVAASLKGYFSGRDVATVVQRYGTNGPRRLVLTAALLITGEDAARRHEIVHEIVQEIVQEIDHAKESVVLAAKSHTKLPTDETKKTLDEAEKKVKSLEANAARLLTDLKPSAADKEEWVFRNSVRTIITGERPNTDFFPLDEKCLDEIRRMTALVA